MKSLLALLVISFVVAASAKIYYSETFDDSWRDRWVLSRAKGSDAGRFKLDAGKYFADKKESRGLKTTEDYKFYQISSKFPEEFSNKGETLVIQFSIKHEQTIDCGGGYIKILPAGLNQKKFDGDAPYNIMFGPDICGPGTRRVHVIFTYKGENHLIKEEIPCVYDEFTHLYTLVVKPDNTYKVLIDNQEKRSGSLPEDWDFLPPQQIKDPEVSKPEDWVDEKEIDDPEDVKPEGWDDIPEFIADPDAEQPEDWDEELDGKWEAPMIENPEYEGEWAPAQIPNPAYKGPWVHPMIDNPEYAEDNEIYAYDSNAFVGIEIWQVKAGSIFDNILVTDSEETASEWAEKSLDALAAEKEQKEKEDEEKAAKEAEEAEKKRQEEEEEEEDEEEEEEETNDDNDHAAHDEL